MAGQNVGIAGPTPEKDAPTAYELKDLHERLPGFTDDELRRIPSMPRGSRLKQGATYINLRDPGCQEFTALGDMDVTENDWYVPKSELHYVLWNRLIGVEDPNRLEAADES